MGPFDRFNDRAKRILALSQDEAIRFNHNYIGPEHVLLGLVREGESAAARALTALGLELSSLRTAVEFMVGRGDASTSPCQITLSPTTKRIIELAIEESRKLGQSHVGTEHLLLGLLREGENKATDTLASFGVSVEQARHQVIATLGAARGDQPRGAGPVQQMFEIALPNGSAVLRVAAEEARLLGHDWLGSEHVLLALLRDSGIASALLPMAITYERALASVLQISPQRPRTPVNVTLTPRTYGILGYARGHADALGRPISSKSLLHALVAERDGIGAQILIGYGATADNVREAVGPE